MLLITKSALFTLIEAAVSPLEATKGGTAVIVDQLGHYKAVVLYDTKQMLEAISQGVIDGDDPRDSIVKNGTSGVTGIVCMSLANPEKDGGFAEGAYVIRATAAKQGNGPLLYDMALSLGKYVVPDRSLVSDEARKIWKYYYEKRGDVVNVPLPDYKKPSANATSVGAKQHTDAPELNAKYGKMAKPAEYQGMVNNDHMAHSAFNEWLKEHDALPVQRRDWSTGIMVAAADYFHIRYIKDVTMKKGK